MNEDSLAHMKACVYQEFLIVTAALKQRRRSRNPPYRLEAAKTWVNYS